MYWKILRLIVSPAIAAYLLFMAAINIYMILYTSISSLFYLLVYINIFTQRTPTVKTLAMLGATAPYKLIIISNSICLFVFSTKTLH